MLRILSSASTSSPSRRTGNRRCRRAAAEHEPTRMYANRPERKPRWETPTSFRFSGFSSTIAWTTSDRLVDRGIQSSSGVRRPCWNYCCFCRAQPRVCAAVTITARRQIPEHVIRAAIRHLRARRRHDGGDSDEDRRPNLHVPVLLLCQTPTRTVGMIASSEVASAWSCVSPEPGERRHEEDAPADAEEPARGRRREPEQGREGVRHCRSIRIAMAVRRPANRNDSVRTGRALLEDAAAGPGGRTRAGTPTSQRVLGLDPLRARHTRFTAGRPRLCRRCERRRPLQGRRSAMRDEQEHRHDHDAPPTPNSALKKPAARPTGSGARGLATRVAATTEPLLDRLTAAPGEAAIFLDFDGVLAPIVERPEDAYPAAAEAPSNLGRPLGRYALVAVVSGEQATTWRERLDVGRRRDRRARTASSSIARPIGAAADRRLRRRGIVASVGDRAERLSVAFHFRDRETRRRRSSSWRRFPSSHMTKAPSRASAARCSRCCAGRFEQSTAVRRLSREPG